MDGRPKNVTVPVHDLEGLRLWAGGLPHNHPDTDPDLCVPLQKLLARIPEPEWEPSPEQISDYMSAMGWGPGWREDRKRTARLALIAAHKVLGEPES